MAKKRAKQRRRTAVRKTVHKTVHKTVRKAVRKTAVKAARSAPRPQARAVEAALAGVAHEIRTPLTGILALAELLAASDLGERERQWADAIKSGAEHLSAMTTLIVDAAKADATRLTLQHEPFSPRRLTEAVGRALKARADTKGLTAEVVIARDLPAMVRGDELRLRAALENLVDNAVKFTEKGSVSLTAGAERAGQRVRLVFTVTDSGAGLSKQDIARLFRPFRQGSEEIARRYGGSGLGLVFVKRVARAMAGGLAVTGTPGRGSTFRLTVSAAPVEGRVPSGDGLRVPGRSLRILCAEDNPYGRVVMNTILTELGHRADFVDDGEAAVSAVAGGSYDVVLMDVTLPLVDGLEATRRIRTLPGSAAQTPIVGVSGRTEPGDEAAARAAGMNFYFTKPVSPARLVDALSKFQRGDRG
jgi:CheY-like chemotaxis protein/nitrogen-specific signal transduction histidine kinase